jgi:hypothetical protein
MGRSTSASRLTETALAVRQARASASDERSRRRLQLAEVRLRNELGGSVPKSVAARVLGISGPALERWVDARRLPAVQRPGGREEIDAEVLLDLAVEVEALRESGWRRRVVAEALGRLERRGLPRRRLRPNESAAELRAGYSAATPVERLHETAELSRVGTILAAAGARRRSSHGR